MVVARRQLTHSELLWFLKPEAFQKHPSKVVAVQNHVNKLAQIMEGRQ